MRIADCGFIVDCRLKGDCGFVDRVRDGVAFAVEECGVDRAVAERLGRENPHEEWHVGPYAGDGEVAQRRDQPRSGEVAGLRRRDHLRHHRIVVHRDVAAFLDA